MAPLRRECGWFGSVNAGGSERLWRRHRGIKGVGSR